MSNPAPISKQPPKEALPSFTTAGSPVWTGAVAVEAVAVSTVFVAAAEDTAVAGAEEAASVDEALSTDEITPERWPRLRFL